MKRLKFLLTSMMLVVMIAALFGAVQTGAAAQNDGLVVSIQAPAAVKAGQDVVVQVTIHNPTRATQKVLRWFTPADGLEEPLFSVSVAGKDAAYIGPVYKRPDVKGEDFLHLKSGESLSWAANLSEVYDFSASGLYTLQFDAAGYQLRSEKAGSLDRLTSNKVQTWVESRAPTAPEPIVPEAVSGSTSFNKCSLTQQSTLITARSEASAYSADALAYLNQNKTGSRYTTWFGVYNSSRYNTARNHFSAISSAMDTAPVTIDCGCKKRYYAYVYPNQPYKIYVCSIFWKAPMTGTDSKAGTLIHEMSHFTVVAGTDDYVYGQSGAKSLAISDPNKAVNNADNHEYFAENTPALP